MTSKNVFARPLSKMKNRPPRNKHIVAEKIDEIISAENPPNCVGGIREFNCTCLLVGRFAAPYDIHSSSVKPESYFLVFYNIFYIILVNKL
jgi:hypothetical protein